MTQGVSVRATPMPKCAQVIVQTVPLPSDFSEVAPDELVVELIQLTRYRPISWSTGRAASSRLSSPSRVPESTGFRSQQTNRRGAKAPRRVMSTGRRAGRVSIGHGHQGLSDRWLDVVETNMVIPTLADGIPAGYSVYRDTACTATGLTRSEQWVGKSRCASASRKNLKKQWVSKDNS
jgi:hypothetical protein